jgi:hypothetical protein
VAALSTPIDLGAFPLGRVIQVLAGGKRGSANRHSDKAAMQIDIWTIISNYDIDYLL